MDIKFNFKINRNRVFYASVIIIVMISGLLSRKFAAYLPRWVGSYAGDVLWALMVYLIIGFIFIKMTSIKTAIVAASFSYFIEFTQLYHAPWIDRIRDNVLGALVLGFGFLWSDLLCYTLGIVIGMCFEKLIFRNVPWTVMVHFFLCYFTLTISK